MNVVTNEAKLIRKIAIRAVAMAAEGGVDYKLTTAVMDITACHSETPLNLQRLMDSKDSDFGHDVFGINCFLDRNTYRLKDCFWPRCGGVKA